MADNGTTSREAVAEEVRSLMGRKRVNQTRLANHLKMSQSALSRRLNGQHPFDTDDLFTIAELFDVEVTRLFPGPKSGWFTGDEVRGSCDTVGETGAGESLVAVAEQGTAGWRSGVWRAAMVAAATG
jgi:transcriptional regulator with XRE-family HTH domain